MHVFIDIQQPTALGAGPVLAILTQFVLLRQPISTLRFRLLITIIKTGYGFVNTFYPLFKSAFSSLINYDIAYIQE